MASRSAGIPRRAGLAAAGAGALALLAAALYLWLTLGEDLADGLGRDVKHALVSTYYLAVSPPRATADLAPVANADVKPYGVNVFLEQEVEEVKVRRSLALIRDAGFAWIKQQVVWAEIETPAKGRYGAAGETWAKYDRIVDLAREYDLGVVLRLDTSPMWARPGRDKLETPPANLRDYGDFVYATVSRYRGKVRYYQLWNEPNLAFEWGDAAPSAAEYVRLLQVGYTRAKEADPDCVVLSAALAQTLERSDRGWNDVDFLQAMYDAGARGYFDVLGANGYGLSSGPDERRLDPGRDVNFARPVLLREVMVRNGDAGKAVWASEVGWDALPPGWPEFPRYGVVTRAQQASYTARAFLRAQEEWPWMGGMAVWHFRMVDPRATNQQHYYFNMVDEQFQPYPLYYAIQAEATAPPVVRRGYHQEAHWALGFSPGWREAAEPRASLGSYAWTDDPAQRLTFRFAGTSLDLVVPRGPDLGRLEITVDGSRLGASALPSAGGRAYLDLAAPAAEWQVRVPVARGLADGVHTAVVAPARVSEVSGAARRVAVDGVVVDGPGPRERLWDRLGAGALLAAGLGLWARGRRRPLAPGGEDQSPLSRGAGEGPGVRVTLRRGAGGEGRAGGVV